jgi:hypothetical protein
MVGKPATAKFNFGHKGLNPASIGTANQNDSGLLKDLAHGRRHTRRTCRLIAPARRGGRIVRRDAGKRWYWIG